MNTIKWTQLDKTDTFILFTCSIPPRFPSYFQLLLLELYRHTVLRCFEHRRRLLCAFLTWSAIAVFHVLNGFIYSKLIFSFSLTFSPIGSGNNGGIIKCVYIHKYIFMCVEKKKKKQTRNRQMVVSPKNS